MQSIKRTQAKLLSEFAGATNRIKAEREPVE